uniref:Protein kinase domain-containing protein n=1 Tax=Steinernema glaseri TaxID=37863 RepID=A0A1I8A1T3_9BILA
MTTISTLSAPFLWVVAGTLLATVHTLPTLTLPLHPYTSILRSFHRPDTIFVKDCPASCAVQFHALALNNSASDCSCICPKDAPAFLPTTGFCVRQLDECAHPIAFITSNRNERLLPVLSLPTTDNVVAPNTRILFQEAGVRINRQGADCQVSKVFLLDDEDLWAEYAADVFYLQLSNGYKKLFWNGTAEDAKRFLGTIVQLKLKCAPYTDARHCLSFRLPGEKEILLGPRVADGSPPRLEVFVIIVLSLLLLASIFTSVVLWRVCWKMKKTELISAIQLQFMYHINHEKQQAAHAARNAVVQTNGSAQAQQTQQANGVCSSEGQGSSAQTVQKRKLFFSAEFFEPHLMADPPPMAEQFLVDLRKMIEIAKNRLRMKRHVPTLVSIPEEPLFETPEITLTDCTQGSISHSESESSPKSVKSIDSGKESMNTSSDSDQEARSAAEAGAKVRKIVNGLEQRANGSATKSRIPVIGSRSPPTKIPSPPTVHSNGIAPGPPPQRPAPPIPTEEQEDCPPPLPATDPPQRPSAKNMRRKAYAVFPGDSMLKKSLPRRSKKNKMLGSNGLIETNM